MNRIVAGSLLTIGFLALDPAWGHGSREVPVSLGPMSTASIVHRLHLMGYSDVAVVKEREGMVDLEVSKGADRYALSVSHELIGPASIAVTNPREVVEKLLQPISRPTIQAPAQ